MNQCLALSLLSLISAAATAQLSNQPGYHRLPVKPFSMTQTRTVTQTYADGLTHTSTEKSTMVRDSGGRTRFESEFPRQGPAIYERDGKKSFQMGLMMPSKTININDPVAQTTLNWGIGETQLHEARLVSYGQTNSSAQRRVPNARPPASDNLPVIEVHTEQLGTRAIQGVIAVGTRITTKFPAGYDGWNREFTTVQENWFASDYGFGVESTFDDPRSGKTVTTLTSFTDGEPDPALFKPPAGYKIITQVTTEAPADKP